MQGGLRHLAESPFLCRLGDKLLLYRQCSYGLHGKRDTVLKKCVSSIFSILICVTINIKKNETYTVANFGNCQ